MRNSDWKYTEGQRINFNGHPGVLLEKDGNEEKPCWFISWDDGFQAEDSFFEGELKVEA
ncbi:hypothetical protein [Arthrobacter sp. H14]|uniref:hypothetical protein n=1 Tax=Arthrobacter sp. H14 TaxID=1312959 RepID=UPI0012DDC522|nr:hypothetical protein [Arthrobacter sp. H14]